MITQTWKVKAIKTWQSLEGLENIVSEVQWEILTECPGKDNHSANGITRLSCADPGNFTAYSQLSESQVIAWVKSALGPTRVAEFERAGWDFMGYTSTVENQNLVFPWSNQ